MKIGVIGALDEELISIRAFIQGAEKIEKGRRVFWRAAASGHEIYLTRCDPGKVNAAIATQQTLDLFGVDAIFNMGSSGALAPHLEVGDLIVAVEFIQHDFDVTDWGLQPGELLFDILTSSATGQLEFNKRHVFNADARLSAQALAIAQTVPLKPLAGHLPQVYAGRILSGDQFIGKPEKAKHLWATHEGLCTDMEAAAIAHVCEVNQIPLLCIRAISDKADHSAALSFTDFLIGATANYGKIFEELIRQLK
ncbi:MAG: 5'-methylthioadenosine/adenosylhomocysteine nucleosidase [Anaerolineales bacterium]|nr:5'-methylthioadenosine/adenosylhomocysteine nucleosidase [Anaerolineales bacterium]